MASVDEVLRDLDQVLDKISMLAEHLEAAEQSWCEGYEPLSIAVEGSSQPDVAALVTIHEELTEYFSQARADLSAVADSVVAYRARLAEPLQGGHAPPRVPRAVEAGDGSRYPVASEWCADMLPRRVAEGRQGEKTVGYVTGSYSPFVSGIDTTWTPAIESRMRRLGIGSPVVRKIVRSHVEMKVATMMIAEGRRKCELTINHVPCGSQPYQPPGCRQILGGYLPKGYTLVVHGTTQQGNPYSFTFEGQA